MYVDHCSQGTQICVFKNWPNITNLRQKNQQLPSNLALDSSSLAITFLRAPKQEMMLERVQDLGPAVSTMYQRCVQSFPAH